MKDRVLKFKDLTGNEGLIREVGEESIEILGNKKRFVLNKESVGKLLPSLAYYAKTGRLPDPSVSKLIRDHPWLGSSWKNDKEVRSGRNELVVCHNCEDLHLWEAGVGCDTCGHKFKPLKDASPHVLDVILKNLNKQQKEKEEREARDRKYPFPEERKDHTYVCQACKKSYTSSRDDDREERIACSEACCFKLLGSPMPKGRKWIGFMTFNAFFKGGKVIYLGEASVNGRESECYHWKMVPGAAPSFYAYYGEGERKHIHSDPGCGSGKHKYQDIVEQLGPSNATDESWRIAANTMKGYRWVKA